MASVTSSMIWLWRFTTGVGLNWLSFFKSWSQRHPTKSYILVFFNQVIKMTPVNAGIVILVGEIVDGSSTLISGALTDKLGFCSRFLQRKISWHIFGTVVALVTFSLMFTPPPNYEPGEWSQSQLMGYYLPWVIFWEWLDWWKNLVNKIRFKTLAYLTYQRHTHLQRFKSPTWR